MNLIPCLAIGLAIAAPAVAQTFPERGRAAVVDAANVIPDDQEAALNKRIADWVNAKKGGAQLAVVTVPSLEGRDIKDYANGLFRKWGLGVGSANSAMNNGVLLLLAPKERKVRIEVGYGLEDRLTDAASAQIIREGIVPKLKAENPAGALSDGADRIMVIASAAPPAPKPPTDSTALWWVLGGILALGGVASGVCIRSARRAARDADAARRACQEQVRPAMTTYRGQRGHTPASSYTPPSPSYSPPSSPSYSSYSSPSYSDYSSPSPSSSDSSSGFDSGGGSSGGGGSDSSY